MTHLFSTTLPTHWQACKASLRFDCGPALPSRCSRGRTRTAKHSARLGDVEKGVRVRKFDAHVIAQQYVLARRCRRKYIRSKSQPSCYSAYRSNRPSPFSITTRHIQPDTNQPMSRSSCGMNYRSLAAKNCENDSHLERLSSHLKLCTN